MKDNINTKLFGRVKKREFKGNLPVPVEELSGPLDEDEGTWMFCSGCGTVLPVLKTAIPLIITGPITSLEGKFIHLDACDLCSEEEKLIEARLEEMPKMIS